MAYDEPHERRVWVVAAAPRAHAAYRARWIEPHGWTYNANADTPIACAKPIEPDLDRRSMSRRGLTPLSSSIKASLANADSLRLDDP
jgi:hypothetical protein